MKQSKPRKVRVVVATAAAGHRYTVRVRAGRAGTGETLYEDLSLPVSGLGEAIEVATTWARAQGYEVYTN